MEEIAPGSILQRIFFLNRLSRMKTGTFLEIGCGGGYLSELILSAGWTGKGFDLGAEACAKSEKRNAQAIQDKRYSVSNADVLDIELPEKYDLIISMMVIEHLSPEDVKRYFKKCIASINPGGRIAVFVPASMKHWGIEDDIAGHFKRYEFNDFKVLAKENHLVISDLSGLTYPLSNVLLWLSNYLVKKNEGHKKDISLHDRTVQSGNRGVKFKTSFPPFLKIVLNGVVLYPFHILQRIFKSNPNSMVIYCEMQKEV